MHNVLDVLVGVIVPVVVALGAVLDAQEAVLDVLDADQDATAHVLETATDVVMGALDNVKTHVLLHAQRRVLVPAKLKHSAL